MIKENKAKGKKSFDLPWQSVLNDLQRTGRTILLLARQQVDSFSQYSCVSPVELFARIQIIPQQESLVLYKSFNSLCA